MLNSQTALLLALLDGPGYGLGLADRLSRRTSGLLRLTPGNLYPALRALEAEGFLASHEEDGPPERGGRPRVVYTLTKRGKLRAETQRDALRALLDG